MVALQLQLFVDPKDPLTYLALPGIRSLLQQHRGLTQWHPLQTKLAKAPAEPDNPDDRGAWHQYHRGQYRQRETTIYAEALGLPMVAKGGDNKSEIAALGLLWLADQQSNSTDPQIEFLDHLLRRHWQSPENLLDAIAAVSHSLAHSGAAVAKFAQFCAGPGPQQLQTSLQQSSAQGITRGPAFLVADQLFIGREHLPTLSALISVQ